MTVLIVTLTKRGVTLCHVLGKWTVGRGVLLGLRSYIIHDVNYGTSEIADYTMAIVLSLHCGRQSSRPWTCVETPLVSQIQSATFDIVGLDLIGPAVALRVKVSVWKVLVYDPFAPSEVDKSLGVDIKELFRLPPEYDGERVLSVDPADL